jgi:nascent polypeptide-associated complex subunit alpha
MLPMNVKQMRKMMKQMGIDVEEVDAVEVIIKTSNEELVFKDPKVTRVKWRGEEVFQVVGSYEVVKKVQINEEDVKLVMEQAGVSEEVAREALIEANGDLVEALMKLQKE